tara:strand:- start:1099 stop:1572 length:474 start_codon:yes stop_codon:yes gene_type:complete
MNLNYLNIYNNLVKLTRNKSLYIKLGRKDTFSERLIIFFFHLAFFLKIHKKTLSKKDSQKLFDYFIRQLELSIREIGYGDVTINKKMKEYLNLFYSILEKIEIWNDKINESKVDFISDYLNINKNIDFYVKYFDKYQLFLSKKSLKIFTKDVIDLKF